AAPMLSTSAATEPTISGETSRYVIWDLAAPSRRAGNHRQTSEQSLRSVSRSGPASSISAEIPSFHQNRVVADELSAARSPRVMGVPARRVTTADELVRPEKVGALIHREVLLSREDGFE